MMAKNLTYSRIWAVVDKIPKGYVATYGQVAELAGLPRQARLVGYALHAASDEVKLPWHRVINSKGRISFPPGTRIYRKQRRLLLREGIRFQDQTIDLKIHRWTPVMR